MTILTKPELTTSNHLFDFLEESGYSERDVLAFNPMTGRIATRNGGLYQITETGKTLHFSGPSPDPTDRM